MRGNDQVRLSVIVPVYNEERSIPPLVEAIRRALRGEPWELLLIDDGSTDSTPRVCSEFASSDSRVRLLRLARNYGQTAAMVAGFDHARGEIIVSLDGDLQNDPRDIPELVEKLGEGFDLVAGYRENRKDSTITRKIPSWLANRIIRWITGVNIRDTGCSLRAYRADMLKRVILYSEMHRFIPAMAASVGGARIAEMPVRHHPRRHGKSKYGLSRAWRVLLDMLTVAMIRLFRDRPLLMFGLASFVVLCGAVLFVVSALVAVETFRPEKAEALVLPGTAALLFGLSIYLLMLGAVGEVFVREYWNQNPESLPVIREVTT